MLKCLITRPALNIECLIWDLNKQKSFIALKQSSFTYFAEMLAEDHYWSLDFSDPSCTYKQVPRHAPN